MTRRRLIVLALALGTALLLPVGAGPAPAWAQHHRVPLAFSAEPAGSAIAGVTAPFTIIGLAWEGAAPEGAWFRTRAGDGEWSRWQPLHLEPDHGPDPGSIEAAGARAGSDPVWTGPQDEAEFRIDGAPPDRAWAAVVDTTDRTKPVLRRVLDRLAPAAAGAAAPGLPAVHPRADWDPAGTCRPPDPRPPEYIQVTAAVIHHTDTSNAYSAAAVPGIILGICQYHVFTREWNDLGYNAVIDRFGGIWEGRAGGLDRGVAAAHTGGFNTYTTGIALLGDFHPTPAPATALQDALVDFLAWKLSVHNLDPHGTTTVVSKGSTRYPTDTRVTLPTVLGHRDASATACPGDSCFALLDTFRDRVAARWTPLPLDLYRFPLVADLDGDGTPEGAVLRDGAWTVTAADGTGRTLPALPAADGWEHAVAGDFDGDGDADLAAFHQPTLTWHAVDENGIAVATRTVTGAGWLDAVVADLDGDGAEEMHAVDGAAVRSWLAGEPPRPLPLTGGWSRAHPGDFDGDGVAELALHHQSGSWYVLDGAGALPWSGPVSASDTVHAGDLDGDGATDLAGFRSPQTWTVLRSTGTAFEEVAGAAPASRDAWSFSFLHDSDRDGRHEIFQLDSWDGSWHRGTLIGSRLGFGKIEDTPYRTTTGHAGPAGSGAAFLTYFAQEFTWLRTDLGTGVDPAPTTVTRHDGADRYATAASLSRARHTAGVPAVYVASGTGFADALAGAVLAARSGGPLLLTDPVALPEATADELVRLAPGRVVLLGGDAAVTPAVATEIADLLGVDVTRLGGADRYATAAVISQEAFPGGATTAYVATGTGFADALAGSAAADGPVLLVDPRWVPAATAAELLRLQPTDIVVLGGEGAIPAALAAALQRFASGEVRRLAGPDRYATAAAVSSARHDGGAARAYIATGLAFPDALAGGAAAGADPAPILLVHPAVLPGIVRDELERLGPSEIIVLGGTGAVPAAREAELAAYARAGLTSILRRLDRP